MQQPVHAGPMAAGLSADGGTCLIHVESSLFMSTSSYLYANCIQVMQSGTAMCMRKGKFSCKAGEVTRRDHS